MPHSRILILSDIHANLTALRDVLHDASHYYPDAVILLGDVVNYGMRPNEVIRELANLPYPVIANIYGNHEKALMDGELSRFSSERGKQILEYTRKHLDSFSLKYIREEMNAMGFSEISVGGKRILVMHGNQDDHYWGKFDFSRISETYFLPYDYVLTGHSHQPHVIPFYFKTDNPTLRYKKKTVFINPGSVGQPRNMNPCAQYALLDVSIGQVQLMAVPYNIETEQRLYTNEVDSFYKERLKYGI